MRRTNVPSSLLGREITWVAIFLAAGFVFRFYHLAVLGLESPYKAGGLFLEFANQIAQDGFLLPKEIPYYTNGGIPFAYPPLAFYVEAVAIHILGLPDFAIVNLLPPISAFISLPLFYVLSYRAGLSKGARLIALGFFALMPNAFVQQIEGAGLAESFGTVALVLLFLTLEQARKKNEPLNYVWLGLAWAFSLLSSPGSAYGSILLFLVFALETLSKGVTARYPHLSLATIVALLASSPYWLTVIRNHGIGIFLNSVVHQYNSGSGSISRVIQSVLRFDLIEGGYAFVWNFCLLLSIVILLHAKRHRLLIGFFLLATVPREGDWMLAVPAALVIGAGLERVISPIRSTLPSKKVDWAYAPLHLGLLLTAIWLAFTPYSIVRANTATTAYILQEPVLEAFDWMRDNTDPDIKVLVFAGEHVQEWLPQVSRRTAINILFGAEWQPEEADKIMLFEDSVGSCDDIDCLWLNSQELVPAEQYLVFFEKPADGLWRKNGTSTVFEQLWENEQVVIGLIYRD